MYLFLEASLKRLSSAYENVNKIRENVNKLVCHNTLLQLLTELYPRFISCNSLMSSILYLYSIVVFDVLVHLIAIVCNKVF